MGTHPIFESDFDCLTDVQNMAEVIFSRQLRVIITSASTSRHHHIELIIERAKEVRSNCYHLRLTDPTDFFFLYTATIDEREFHQLKQDQQLTIDYATFSGVVIELLTECSEQEGADQPSKRLELNIQTLRSTLAIVEPRRIRNITELKLFFNAADDAQQKAYLASSLKQYQTATLSKETKLNRQIEGLERELAEYRVKCDELNNDNGELRNRGQLQLDELKNQFEHKLNIEREKNMNEIKDKNSSHDTALKQYENQINAKIRRLETRISELQRTNEDHLHLKTRAENTVREQKIRIDSLTSEQQRILSENAQGREVKEEMNRQNKNRSERVAQLKAEVAAKTAELNECRANQARLDRQAQMAIDQKSQLDEKYQRLMGQAEGMSGDNEQLKSDLCKANDIIQRKMDEVKQFKYKYRRNEEVIKKQEELLGQKDLDMKTLGMRIKDAQDKEAKHNTDNERLSTEKAHTEAQLKVALEKTQQNDKVIAYLNKQLNQMPLMKTDNRLSDGYIPIPTSHHPTGLSTRTINSTESVLRNLAPKDQSTPITRLNRSDENQPNGLSGRLTLTGGEGATSVKPLNLPRPLQPTSLNNKNNVSGGSNTSAGGVGGASGSKLSGTIDPKYLAPTATTKAPMAPISAYFASASSGHD